MTVRTRIAPSPTGNPHLGTAYIALFNLCFARAHKGQFILRIEDTDQKRSSKFFEERILSALRWLGLDWDEGPDVGGKFGPYRQSMRSQIYHDYASKLLQSGHAFRCFCTLDQLDKIREERRASGLLPGYDGQCMKLSQAEVEHKLSRQTPYVIRMQIPQEGNCTFRDKLRGDIEIEWRQVDMQVLIKSDGKPTYHLACVVDDHLMGITHVIRGEEWINSTPKHLKLYQSFGWEPPVFCHLPLLRNPDHSKLSKRKHPTSIEYYRSSGLLPEALLNYLALMGWSMPDGSEKFSLQEMIGAFEIEKISLGGPVFDANKLNWLSGEWIRQLPPGELLNRFINWLPSQERLDQLAQLVQPRIERFGQVLSKTSYLLGDLEPPTEEALLEEERSPDTVKRILQFTIFRLGELENWDKAAIQEGLSNLANQLGLSVKVFLKPLFISMTGKQVSLPLFDSILFIGKEVAIFRLRQSLKSIGGISKKDLKLIDKEWYLLSELKQLMDATDVLKKQLNSVNISSDNRSKDGVLDLLGQHLQATLKLMDKTKALDENSLPFGRWWILQKLWLLESAWSPEQWEAVDKIYSSLESKYTEVNEENLVKRYRELSQQREVLLKEWQALLAKQRELFPDDNPVKN